MAARRRLAKIRTAFYVQARGGHRLNLGLTVHTHPPDTAHFCGNNEDIYGLEWGEFRSLSLHSFIPLAAGPLKQTSSESRPPSYSIFAHRYRRVVLAFWPLVVPSTYIFLSKGAHRACLSISLSLAYVVYRVVKNGPC